MKPGEYEITVCGVEGVVCAARINLGAIMLQAEAEPVSLAIEEARAMELVTVLSIVAGGCEAVVWRQQREESERKAAELRAMEALRAEDNTGAPTCAINEEGRHECCE